MSSHQSFHGLQSHVLQGIARGEQWAIERVYDHFAERLCRFAEKEIGDRVRKHYGPEDAGQSAFGSFVRLVGKREYVFKHSGALWNFLKTIALNKIRDAAPRPGDTDLLDPDQLAGCTPSEHQAYEVADAFEGVLKELSGRDAKIFENRYLEEATIGETAKAVKCSRWTVRRVLDRNQVLVRRKFRAFENNDSDV